LLVLGPNAQGTILCVDQRFSDWFGRSPGELVGRPFNSIATEQVSPQSMVLRESIQVES
jgi:hypothetical protein